MDDVDRTIVEEQRLDRAPAQQAEPPAVVRVVATGAAVVIRRTR
jgi:hypothetical protein